MFVVVVVGGGVLVGTTIPCHPCFATIVREARIDFLIDDQFTPTKAHTQGVHHHQMQWANAPVQSVLVRENNMQMASLFQFQ